MYSLTKKIFIICLVIFVASCGGKKSSSNALEPNKKPKVKNVFDLKRVWSRDIGGSFKKDISGFQLTADNDVIYGATKSGRLAAIEKSTGKRLWSSKSKKSLSAGIDFGLENVYVANDDGVVLAYDKNTGAKKWEKQLSSEILVSPVEAATITVVRSQDGKIIGLNSDNGEQEWAIQRDVPNLSLRRDIKPVVVGKVAIIGLPNGQLLALDASIGRALWDVPISVPSGVNELERMRDIAGKPIVNRNIIYLNSFQGDIVSFDGSNRKLIWRQNISSPHQMAEDSTMLFATENDSNIIALNKSDGDIAWENDLLLRRGVSAPSVVGKYILVFGNDGDMYFFTKADGDLVGRFSFPGKRVIGMPVISNDAVSGKTTFYALSDNGNVYSYEVEN